MKKRKKHIKNIIDILYKIKDTNSAEYNFFVTNYEELVQKREKNQLRYIMRLIFYNGYLMDFHNQKLIYNLKIATQEEFQEIFEYDDMDILDYCQKNIIKIINELDIEKSIFIVEFIEIFDKDKEYVNNFLKNNKKLFLERKMRTGLSLVQCTDKDRETLLDIIVLLTDEILEHENQTLLDITNKTPGGYSAIYIIGSKVLKIGMERETYKIPYDRRIIVPLIRINLNDISNMHGTIEVTEIAYIDRIFSLNSQRKIFNQMYDRNVINTDLKSNNLGILIKPNIVHWNKTISLDLEPKGFIVKNKNKIKVLRENAIVIIDTDFIYYTNDEDKIYIKRDVEYFERQYLEKKRQKEIKVKKLGTMK